MKLENFLLKAIDETSTIWAFSANQEISHPEMLIFKKSEKEKIIIKSVDLNNWGINFVHNSHSVQMLIPISDIPLFVEKALSCGENNFQLNFRKEGENYFKETDKFIEDFLRFGNKKISVNYGNNSITLKIKDKEKFQISVKEIESNYLGSIVVNCTSIEDNGYNLSYKKLIPIHKIEEYKSLKNIVFIPEIKKKDINLNEDEFLNKVINLKSEFFSKIAFKFLLENQLPEKLIKNKLKKI